MLTENQFGVIFDVIHFPKETKDKILALRNMKIKQGQVNYTCTDAIVYAINCAHELEKLADAKIRQDATSQALETVNSKRPNLSGKGGANGNG